MTQFFLADLASEVAAEFYAELSTVETLPSAFLARMARALDDHPDPPIDITAKRGCDGARPWVVFRNGVALVNSRYHVRRFATRKAAMAAGRRFWLWR